MTGRYYAIMGDGDIVESVYVHEYESSMIIPNFTLLYPELKYIFIKMKCNTVMTFNSDLVLISDKEDIFSDYIAKKYSFDGGINIIYSYDFFIDEFALISCFDVLVFHIVQHKSV